MPAPVSSFWFLLAVAASLGAYALYLLGMRRHLVTPNRASWLIWSAAAGVEAATYTAVNPQGLQNWVFVLSALAALAVTLGIWRRGDWERPSITELACMAACLLALVLWLAFRSAFWAHMLVVAAVPVSFWPTWASTRADPARERSPAWGWWTVGDLATLLVATRGTGGVGGAGGEYAYILVELACHASMWLIIGLPTINPLRSLGWRRGRFYVLDAHGPGASPFRIGETHLGKAVYAARGFARGETIIRFTGPHLGADRVPPMRGRRDRYVQIGPDTLMGPSGGIDDLINHNCAPNAGLRFLADGIFLIAVADIAPGEEIGWDYSTTLLASDWRMACQCRAPGCRGTIGNFATLPPDRQQWYRARNLVAPYLREAQEAASDEPRRASAG